MNEATLSAWPMTTESARGPAKSGPVVLPFFKTKPQLNKKKTRRLPYFTMRLAFSDSGHCGGWKIRLSDFFPLKTHFPPIFHSKHLNNLVKPIFKLQKRKLLVQNQESTRKPISSWSHIWIF